MQPWVKVVRMFENDREYLDPASVQYGDWRGTSAADDADPLVESPSLYKVVGIDQGEWMIVGFSLYRGSGKFSSVTVYAVDRKRWNIGSYEDWQALADERGAVPTTAFDVRDVDLMEFIDAVFKRFSVRLEARGVAERGHRIEILEHREV
jgi:hypothetical protein